MIKQAVIFCGGFGTRFNNNKTKILKPLAKINGKPILKIIIDIYYNQGINEFLLLGGFRFNLLKKFEKKYLSKKIKIPALNTGLRTTTAGRLIKAKKLIQDKFFLTYGDSIANFSVKKFESYKLSKKFYVSTYDYKIPYGVIISKKDNNINKSFEKSFKIPINAGFYVLNKKIFKFIKSQNNIFEDHVLKNVIRNKTYKLIKNKLSFWHPMDYKDDKNKIESILKNKKIV